MHAYPTRLSEASNNLEMHQNTEEHLLSCLVWELWELWEQWFVLVVRFGISVCLCKFDNTSRPRAASIAFSSKAPALPKRIRKDVQEAMPSCDRMFASYFVAYAKMGSMWLQRASHPAEVAAQLKVHKQSWQTCKLNSEILHLWHLQLRHF